MVARLTHRDDEALDSFTRAVEQGSDARPEFMVDAYANLLELLVEHGRKADALEHAERMVQRFPNDTRAKSIRDGLR